MVVLGGVINFWRSAQFRRDRFPVSCRIAVDGGLGLLHLRLTIGENRRAILRSNITALTVPLGRVVMFEEDLQDFIKADNRRIENDMAHFSVTSFTCADEAVIRFLRLPA